MCIIAVKPAGVAFDDTAQEWLINCAAANKDGAGVMWTDGNVVNWHKGFMGADAEKRTLEYARKLPADRAAVFHFRIGTHGKVDARTTHPFPVNSGSKALRALKGKARIVVAHNGIISQMARHEMYSDTQQLIRYLNDLSLKAAQLCPVLELVDGGKFAVMTPNTITLVGKFEKESNGWQFSNTSYKGRTAQAITTYSNGAWTRKGRRSWWEIEKGAGMLAGVALATEGKDECVSCGQEYEIEDMHADMWGSHVCEDCYEFMREEMEFEGDDSEEGAGVLSEYLDGYMGDPFEM